MDAVIASGHSFQAELDPYEPEAANVLVPPVASKSTLFQSGLVAFTMAKMVLSSVPTLQNNGAMELLDQQPDAFSASQRFAQLKSVHAFGGFRQVRSYEDRLVQLVREILHTRHASEYLTLAEAERFPLDSPHRGFIDWLLRDRATNFRRFDVDSNAQMSKDELLEALRVFMAPNAGGVPARSRMTRPMVDGRDAGSARTQLNVNTIFMVLGGIVGGFREQLGHPLRTPPHLRTPPRRRLSLARRDVPFGSQQHQLPTAGFLNKCDAPPTGVARELGTKSLIHNAPWYEYRHLRPCQARSGFDLTGTPKVQGHYEIGEGTTLGRLSRAEVIEEAMSAAGHRGAARAIRTGEKSKLEGVIRRRNWLGRVPAMSISTKICHKPSSCNFQLYSQIHPMLGRWNCNYLG